MARPRKPVELLQLSGTFYACRHRDRLAAPKSGRLIGDPPAHLAADERAAWVEFVGNMPAGVLTGYDRWALEALARLLARSRRQGLTGSEWGTLRALLREMGASPASRARVQPVGPPRRPRRTHGTCRRRARSGAPIWGEFPRCLGPVRTAGCSGSI
jgi:hypothetical protein